MFFPENQGDRALTEPDYITREAPLHHGNRRIEDENKGVSSARYSQPLRNINEIERISDTLRKSKTVTAESPSVKGIHRQQPETPSSNKYEDPPIARYKTLSGYNASSARQSSSIPSDSELYKPLGSGTSDRRISNYSAKNTDPTHANKEMEEKHKEDSKSERKRTLVTDEGRAMIPRDAGSPYKKKLKKLLQGSSTNK